MKLVCQSNGKLYLRNVSYEERNILALLGAKFLPGEGYSGKFKGSHGGEVYQQVEVFQLPVAEPTIKQSKLPMNDKQIELFYGWQETECGVYHAFHAEDAENHPDEVAIACHLAEQLDTTVDSTDFDWNSMYIDLPETLLERLRGEKRRKMTLAESQSAPVGISIADAIVAARKQFAWNPVKGEPFSANVAFLNLDGEEDETQLDLYSDTPEQELEELWASLAEEMESTLNGIISVEAVPFQN